MCFWRDSHLHRLLVYSFLRMRYGIFPKINIKKESTGPQLPHLSVTAVAYLPIPWNYFPTAMVTNTTVEGHMALVILVFYESPF